MDDKYIVFDVETPNSANDRMSSIGITVIENGRITGKYGTLINPETHFDYFNISLTGITPESVASAPTFPELWEKIESIMSSGVLIAHNARFDMSVLAKCLNFYGIEWRGHAYYACTCVMGRVCYPDLDNYRLNTLCDYLGISLSHHKAESDSYACAEIFLDYISHGISVEKYIRKYDMKNICTIKA